MTLKHVKELLVPSHVLHELFLDHTDFGISHSGIPSGLSRPVRRSGYPGEGPPSTKLGILIGQLASSYKDK